ncbi:hypothetical protein CI109_103951 [Kwoniella shandongensis]|uniref:Protein HIR n=1 Tax=Kwoniella shandongensis TaxID=1734106 RepID=A0A5M6BYG7_9TREE|nr:uncharacterized protein CI109_005594 [Kwoniella shandongensis]KAA5525999.1 hypothetical protein CI109_005594 [Kwoniella shandongensis]
MRVCKPSWVEHTSGDKKNKCPIYSISVHPDGTRLATGGLDHKVKIWSTLPILDPAAEKDDENHKLLCTMAAHTGPVLSVRWAHHGRFLATGSDDQVIMIWGIDPDGGGRLWGSDEVNVENWKALTRLVGHVADVVDLAWSRDDSMLASVGLDSKVWIWDGYSFERLRKLDLHQGFVKGVCWDPVGNFLATQSDDKTVKIWNTEDWTCVQTISKPFETSPQSTFFRRLSWSPDGAFVAASNAKNGPVFVAAVIDRDSWSSDISFVGHENTIQVAAFNPRLFFRKGDEPGRATASCMLALGANDFSISIWRNSLHKPPVVFKEVFGRDLLDLCWSNDGFNLYGSSADGSICAISFDPEEFPELAEPEATDVVLKEYGYKPQQRISRAASVNPIGQIANGFGPSTSSSTTVNVLQPRKGKAKSRRIDLANGSSNGNARSLQPPSADPFGGPIQSFGTSAQETTARMFQEAQSAFGSSSRQTNGDFGNSPRTGLKRKASLFADGEGDRAVRGRLMPTTQARQNEVVQVIRAPHILPISSGSTSSRILSVPQVQSVVRATQTDVKGGTAYLEAHNAVDAIAQNLVTFHKDGQSQWVEYLPSAVLSLAVTSSFSAVACEDGSVRVYSLGGRHLSNMKLASPCHDIQGNKDMLLIVTSDCQVRVIDTRKAKAVFPATSLSHLLDPPPSSSSTSAALVIKQCTVRPNGVPIIQTSEPAAYAYDPTLYEWTNISSAWWAESSPLTNDARGGPLAEIESAVASVSKGKKRSTEEWWNETVTMGHYETKLSACLLIESVEEYQHWLVQYVQYLGNEDFLARAEELVKDLVGPIYQPSTSTGWNPRIMGMQKREIAKQILGVLENTKKGGEVAREYASLLRSIEAESQRWQA